MHLSGINNWKNKTDFENLENITLARITAVNKTNYNIICKEGEFVAELSGRLMYTADPEKDIPVTGDFVQIDLFDELAIIHEVLPRFSFIKRKSSGKKVEFQSIAANLDFGLIVQAIDSDFNLRRLERYLAMIYDSEIVPIVILTKSDLVSEEEKKEKVSSINDIYNELKILTVSNISGSGINEIKNILEEEKTYCLIGSSGVGKSTLINNLAGKEIFATGDVRESDKKGKHTTTRRELLVLENGSILIDTPGMRELANFNIDDGLSETFGEIDRLSSECKFSDCNHISDSGCAILNAVDIGQVSEDRYKSFIKLKKESEYYESSYLEKRKKDKEFGKMVKTVMKEKKVKKNRY